MLSLRLLRLIKLFNLYYIIFIFTPNRLGVMPSACGKAPLDSIINLGLLIHTHRQKTYNHSQELGCVISGHVLLKI